MPRESSIRGGHRAVQTLAPAPADVALGVEDLQRFGLIDWRVRNALDCDELLRAAGFRMDQLPTAERAVLPARLFDRREAGGLVGPRATAGAGGSGALRHVRQAAEHP